MNEASLLPETCPLTFYKSLSFLSSLVTVTYYDHDL